MHKQKHEFAVYYEFINSIDVGDLLKISEEFLYHRLIRVLRCDIDDEITLFNKDFNILAKFIEIKKKEVVLEVLNKKINERLSPKITVLISVLKKESFQEAIYLATELGANIIQPLITDKAYPRKIDSKEIEKLNKTIISAAELSKNFSLPILKEPLNLNDFLKLNNAQNCLKVFFDPEGAKVTKILDSFNLKDEIYLLIGPEGDLTLEEKNRVKESNFVFCSLTPTILKAPIATAVALGIFRSFFK